MKTPNPDDIVEYQANPVTKIKRNVTIDKRRTTLMLEQEIWTILDELAREEGLSIDELCNQIHHFMTDQKALALFCGLSLCLRAVLFRLILPQPDMLFTITR